MVYAVDARSALRLRDRYAKPAVVLCCSALWLLVSVVRIPDATGGSSDMSLDSSWVIGLAASFQEGAIAGRDFQFTYGPAAQIIASIGAWLNADASAYPALPLILLSFWSYGILLLAIVLLLV